MIQTFWKQGFQDYQIRIGNFCVLFQPPIMNINTIITIVTTIITINTITIVNIIISTPFGRRILIFQRYQLANLKSAQIQHNHH